MEIALLRAAGIPARYVYGTIQLPADQAMNWVGGVTTAGAAQSLLGQGQVQAKQEIKDEIADALAAGKEATIHEAELNVSGWTGSGYIIIDPDEDCICPCHRCAVCRFFCCWRRSGVAGCVPIRNKPKRPT